MKRSAIFLVFIVFCLGLVSCGGGGPTNTSNYGPGVLFVETWESYPVGSLPGGGWRWPDPDLVPYFEREVDIPTNHKLLLHGPNSESGWGYGGVRYPFKRDTMKPTYIHYKVHPYPNYHEIELESTDVGHFRIMGYKANANFETHAIDVSILLDSSGMGSIMANSSKYPGNSRIPVDQSFQIEIKNIQWNVSIQTYDLWINGYEVLTCIEFSNPIESISALSLYNGRYGRVHFDDIYMADLDIEYNCPVVSEDPPSMPLPPQPSPTEPTDPVLFIFELPAFCRGGPSTEYPKISTYPEDTQLEITGQNIEGSWWWSENGNCWVSDSVGRLVGDKTTLDIIIPLPPLDKSDPADKNKGKPASCKQSLGKDACIKAGGTWDEQPTQAGTCVCP